jgi:phosphatidate cytidylyltransferase
VSRRQRITTALLLAPLPILAILFLPTPWLAAAVAAVLLLGLWEWTRLAGLEDLVPRAGVLTANALLIAALAWGSANQRHFPLWAVAMIGATWWAFVPLWLARPKFASGDQTASRMLKLLAGSLCIIPAWCALGLLHFPPLGPRWTLFAIALVWAADSGAYFTGSKIGKRKLAPSISPGKTWEGVAGGLVTAMVLSAIALPLLGLAWSKLPALALLTAVTAAVSVVGDLFESVMKRQAGMKDSGDLFPGHGGMMDRIDSLLAALPVFLIGKELLNL